MTATPAVRTASSPVAGTTSRTPAPVPRKPVTPMLHHFERLRMIIEYLS